MGGDQLRQSALRKPRGHRGLALRRIAGGRLVLRRGALCPAHRHLPPQHAYIHTTHCSSTCHLPRRPLNGRLDATTTRNNLLYTGGLPFDDDSVPRLLSKARIQCPCPVVCLHVILDRLEVFRQPCVFWQVKRGVFKFPAWVRPAGELEVRRL